MPIAAALIGGVIQASAANKAAKAQTNAANKDIEFQRDTRDKAIERVQPFYKGGVDAQSAYDFELGIGARPTFGGTAYGGFTKTPGYDFRMKQGQESLEAGAAARGGLYSGAAMQALQENGQNFATNEYGTYMNRLAGRADSGLSAATLQNSAGQAAAVGTSNALANIGDAKAAGAIGVGNAFTGGLENALGAWQYQKQMAQPTQPDNGGKR